MVLTERQKKDLHKSILEYLYSDGGETTFPKTIEAFRAEAQINETLDFGKNLLEKKWTSVVRLQKRVMDLEAEISELKKNGFVLGGEKLNSGQSNGSDVNNRLLPKGPARSIMSGHRGAVLCLASHPIFSLVASGSDDSTIKIWDYEIAQYERTFKGHTGAVTGVCFNSFNSSSTTTSATSAASNNVFLASCSADMTAKIWDLKTGNCIKTLKDHDHTLSGIKFMPSGDHLVTCSRDKTIKLWETSSGYCIKTLSGHTDWVKAIAISLDGEYIASSSTDQTIMVWRFSTGKCEQVLRGHTHVIECVSFGKKATTANEIVNSFTSPTPSPMKDTSTLTSPSLHDGITNNIDNSYLASGSRDNTVRLWDALKGTCLMIFTDHENWVRGVLVHPSGKYIISTGEDKSIRVFDIKEGRCMRTIADAHTHFVTSIVMSANHPVYITASIDKNISVWPCN